jgi:hypothetical protein
MLGREWRQPLIDARHVAFALQGHSVHASWVVALRLRRTRVLLCVAW